MCAVAVRHQTDLRRVVGVHVDGVYDRVHELLHDVKVLLSHAAGRVEDEHNIRVPGASCATETNRDNARRQHMYNNRFRSDDVSHIFGLEYFLIRDIPLSATLIDNSHVQYSRPYFGFLNSRKHSPC